MDGYFDGLEFFGVPGDDALLEVFDGFADFFLELADFLVDSPHLLDSVEFFVLDEFLAEVFDEVHPGVLDFGVGFGVLLLLVLDLPELAEVLFLGHGVGPELLVAVSDLLALGVVDEGVVDVAEVGELADEVVLVLGLLGEGVAGHVEDLEALEPHALGEVGLDDLEAGDLVVADGEHVELLAVVEPLELGDLVVVERQVGEVDQVVQPLDLLDRVERQV